MWLSEKVGRQTEEPEKDTLGVVSIGGAVPAVVTDGELRRMRILAPKGFLWQPKEQDTVLCIGDCIAGKVQQTGTLLPDEIRIENGQASLSLRADGKIYLTGRIYLNGRLWETEEETE